MSVRTVNRVRTPNKSSATTPIWKARGFCIAQFGKFALSLLVYLYLVLLVQHCTHSLTVSYYMLHMRAIMY
jgi:hypothetical protein